MLDELCSAGHESHVAAGGVARADLPCALTQMRSLEARATGAVDLGPVVESFCPDVIHLHNIMNPAALEWAASARPPALVTVQDHRFFCPGSGKWTSSEERCAEPMSARLCGSCFDDEAYLRRTYALTSRRLAAISQLDVVVLSNYMRLELVAAGMEPVRIHVIAPFVHGLDPMAQPDGPPCVAFVGRLARAKGVEDAVEAWRLSSVDLPLIFAGTGPERARLEKAGFEVLGWLRRDALARFYRRAAVILMPSRWQEPFGIVGIEALSLGTPVVAWHSGGIAEWHSGGELVAWGDTVGLAQELRRAAADVRPAPDQRFGPDRPMSRLVALYNSMRAAALGRAPLG